MGDWARLRNGLQIQRPKFKANLMNESGIKACVSRYDSGAYDTLQFLRDVSHTVGAHMEALQPSQDATALMTMTRSRHGVLTARPTPPRRLQQCQLLHTYKHAAGKFVGMGSNNRRLCLGAVRPSKIS